MRIYERVCKSEGLPFFWTDMKVSLRQNRVVIDEHRPHRSLKGLMPREYASKMKNGAANSLS